MLKSLLFAIYLPFASTLVTACGGGEDPTSGLTAESLQLQEQQTLQARSITKFANKSFLPSSTAADAIAVN